MARHPPARLTVAREPDWLRMTNELTFRISTTPFDEHYSPSAESRATTNFANLARGEDRRQNLRNVLTMIDRRCNDLARWDNPDGDRYAVELEIVSVDAALTVDGDERHFPLLEVLDVHIRDLHTGARHHGIVGNNFSSYIRDYDFSVRLPAVAADAGAFTVPDDFGALHGALFQAFLDSDAYRARFEAPPVICISVSTSKTYRRTDNTHPVLGVEYLQSEYSLTDEYFSRMGLRVRYFMPAGAAAPLAFYFRGDLANDYTNLQLVGTISTMESFQKIYRPEIYNANAAAGSVYRPSLEHGDFSRTQIDYDRVERAQLAITQGTYAAEHFLAPYGDVLARWVGLEPALAG